MRDLIDAVFKSLITLRHKYGTIVFGYVSARPFLYFDPPTLLRPKLYFEVNLTSTFLAKLYFDQNFTSTSLLRPKLYFDLYFSTNKKSRFVKRSKYRGRSKRVEVKRSNCRGRSRAVEVQKRSKVWKWSKYRKGRTTAYPSILLPYIFPLYIYFPDH